MRFHSFRYLFIIGLLFSVQIQTFEMVISTNTPTFSDAIISPKGAQYLPSYSNIINSTNLTTLSNININGFTEMQSFAIAHHIPGAGTESNPFLIQNFLLSNSSESTPIIIRNVDQYLQIQNCWIQNAEQAITITNLDHITLKDLLIEGSEEGIQITDSGNVLIDNVTIRALSGKAIVLSDNDQSQILASRFYDCAVALQINNCGDFLNISHNTFCTLHSNPILYDNANGSISYNNFLSVEPFIDIQNTTSQTLIKGNFWESLTYPDLDKDGEVDDFYTLNSNYRDLFPKTKLWEDNRIEILATPALISPNISEELSGYLSFEWTPSSSTSGGVVSYSFEIKNQENNATLSLVSRISSTKFAMDLSNLTSGTYQLNLSLYSNDGLKRTLIFGFMTLKNTTNTDILRNFLIGIGVVGFVALMIRKREA